MQKFLLLLIGVIGAHCLSTHRRSGQATADAKNIPKVPETCGYESCVKPKEGLLNVHIVPHTHDDVGWLKTVDQYYYGSRNNIQKAGVQYILDSVVKELWEDPKRKFIYVETAFFWKWWVHQSDAVQQKVQTLVRQGRLQFVGGAWSMNDEAASHYQSTIDQFTWGLSKLNKTFGYCGLPRVGWQIDPFGHSREFASLLSLMGYDGLFLGRIDYQDKMNRLRTKTMEMIWRGDDHLGKASDIFTGVLHNTYSPPPGFCFDVLCNDEPIVDDPESPINNVEQKIATFVELCQNYSKEYLTNNILITMGEDFHYQDAGMWFKNLDRLIQSWRLSTSAESILRNTEPITFSLLWIGKFIEYVQNQAKYYRTNNVIITMGGDFTYQDATMWYMNLDKLIKNTNLIAARDDLNINLFYSTPNCYLKAVRDSNPQLPTKEDDFFPYASDSTAYWTGYFTSRPTTKYFEREANDYLQMVKQLQVLTNLDKHNQFVLNELKSAMGVMQHHDAITGTEKQHVTHDYERLLNTAVDDALIIAKQGLNKAIQKDGSKPPLLEFKRCHLNESRCSVSENSEQFVVTIYNPLGWARSEPIRIPVFDGTYKVYAPNGKEITSQLVEIPKTVLTIPTRRSIATHEIVFIAHLKPLGYKSFYIKKNARVKRESNFEYFPNVYSEYFDMIREKFNEHIKESESENVVQNKIPLAPVVARAVEYKDANVDLLKDGTNDNELFELKKFLNSYKSNYEANRHKIKIESPKLSDEEMRMLSDEPKTVERFDEITADLENQRFKLNVDVGSGKIRHINFPDESRLNFSINMYYYPGAKGHNTGPLDRASGAYIFRPNATNPKKLYVMKTEIVNGEVVKEFRVNLKPNGYLSTKLYDNLNFIENEFVVGPIPIEDGIGKEYIVKYETNILNNGEFYTDSNGRQMLKRKLNKRPQWNVTLAEPIAGNYYPVTNEIYIKDDDRKITVLTDRSEGGTSLIEGEIELMLHRRLLYDDAFGVGEALNETAKGRGLVVRGKHRILITNSTENVQKQVLAMHLAPIVLVSDAKDVKLDDWKKLANCFSFINGELPYGVHLLTLEPWDDKVLIRLENYLEKDKNSDIEVDIGTLLHNVNVKAIKETLLAANIWADEYKKWMWNGDSIEDIKKTPGFKVKLRAKEIRTFVVDYESN